MNEQYINDLAKRVFDQNKAAGWWDNMDRDILETLMLVVTEIAEATEGVRKDLMDDHLPHRKMEEVELADTVIRVVDLGGRYGWEYYETKTWDELTSSYAIEGQIMPPAAEHFSMVLIVSDLAQAFFNGDTADEISHYYSMLVGRAFSIAKSRGYDLKTAIEEKLVYNRQRADHKRENRAAVGGKRF